MNGPSGRGLYLGLDIGTSVIKAALLDEAGLEIASTARRNAASPAPPGWSELDAERTWAGVIETLAAVMKGQDARRLRAMGVTGVMVGAWLIDGDGAVLRPPILWNDARAQALVDGMLARTPDLYERVFDGSGSLMQLGCILPVLAWLKENEPEHVAAAQTVLCAKDYLRFRLTGTLATDESEAAMAPGSARARGFDRGQAQRLGVADLWHLLPPVGQAGTLAGTITAAAAAETGLPEGLPVAVGTGDTGASVLGAGCSAPGQAATVLGTTCLSGVLSETPAFEPRQGLLFILPEGLWMRTMVNIAGTTVLDWALSALAPDIAAGPDPYEALGRVAEAAPAHAEGALFLPYLSDSGVIAPKVEPRARAGFFGLTPRHDRPALVRAVYEGLAHAIRHCYGDIGASLSVIRLSGGGARSTFWSQMIADATGIPVEIPAGREFGAKGAALCGATAVGDFASVREASAATFALSRRHEPDAAAHAAFGAAHEAYLAASAAGLGPLTGLTR